MAAAGLSLAELYELPMTGSSTQAYRATLRRLAPLLGGLVVAALVVAVLDLTLVGLPIAIWLTIRWSLLAPAVALDLLDRVEAETPRHNRWTGVAVLGVGAAALAGLLGADPVAVFANHRSQ